MKKNLDLTGQQFDKWTVLSHRKIVGKNIMWLSECKCGHRKFLRQHNLLKECSNRCPKCWTPIRLHGKNHPHWKGHGDISAQFWRDIIRQAKKRHLEFDISMEYVWDLFEHQKGECALTGIKLQFTRFSNDNQRTASLDRIDSNIGYIPANIQWVHKKVNMMKQSMSDKELLSWCRAVVAHATISV